MKEQDLVQTRQYTDEELQQPPWRTIAIKNKPKFNLLEEDLAFEDTMPVYVSSPRFMWKYFYEIKVANDLDLSDIISSFIATFFEYKTLPGLAAEEKLDKKFLTELMRTIDSYLESIKQPNEDEEGEN
jgi:hypothetical protein